MTTPETKAPVDVKVVAAGAGMSWAKRQLTMQNIIMTLVLLGTIGNWVNNLWIDSRATAQRQQVSEALYLADRQRAQEVYTQQQVMFERVTVTLDSIKERLSRIEAQLKP